jgi:hypothetical protein
MRSQNWPRESGSTPVVGSSRMSRSGFQEGLTGYRGTGSRWALPFWLGAFAAALPESDEQRITILDQAFEAVEATQERVEEAELYRLRGDFARTGRSPNDDLAEKNYSTAKRIAQEQGQHAIQPASLF